MDSRLVGVDYWLMGEGANVWNRGRYLIDGGGLRRSLGMGQHFAVSGCLLVQPAASIRADGHSQTQAVTQMGAAGREPSYEGSYLAECIPVRPVHDGNAERAIMEIEDKVLPQVGPAASMR
ncbi:MAG TPA: hypothetical protein VKP13_12385 [Nitrospira sp.]|nr:hypothetical protein [Nitrospira sp.]